MIPLSRILWKAGDRSTMTVNNQSGLVFACLAPHAWLIVPLTSGTPGIQAHNDKWFIVEPTKIFVPPAHVTLESLARWLNQPDTNPHRLPQFHDQDKTE